ncbi:MAG: L,D-transpeptidase family protein [Verrucomicrobiales bacterium]
MKALLLFLPLLLLAACSPTPMAGGDGSYYLAGYQQSTPQAANPNDPNQGGYWDDSGVSGPASIRINLAEQKSYFYKGGHLVGVTPISTGTEGRNTPRGRFKVTEKDIDHRSSLYGVIKNRYTGQIVNDDADTRKDFPGPDEVFERAPMFNFLRFNGAIGMHTGHLPGYPASHGCVRLPDHMARHFYENASLGTPVIVE